MSTLTSNNTQIDLKDDASKLTPLVDVPVLDELGQLVLDELGQTVFVE